jgi:hypothetical protein
MTEGAPAADISYLATKWGSETDINTQFGAILDATNDAENDLGLNEWRLSNVEETNLQCANALLEETKAIVTRALMEKDNLSENDALQTVNKTFTNENFEAICKKVAQEVSFLLPEKKMRAIKSTYNYATRHPGNASYAVDYAPIDATKLTYRVLEGMGFFKTHLLGRDWVGYSSPGLISQYNLPNEDNQGNVNRILQDEYQHILKQTDVNNLFEIQSYDDQIQSYDDHAGAQINQPSRTVRVVGEYFPAEPVVKCIAHFVPGISKTRLLSWTVLIAIDREQFYLPFVTAIMAIVTMVYFVYCRAYNKGKQHRFQLALSNGSANKDEPSDTGNRDSNGYLVGVNAGSKAVPTPFVQAAMMEQQPKEEVRPDEGNQLLRRLRKAHDAAERSEADHQRQMDEFFRKTSLHKQKKR